MKAARAVGWCPWFIPLESWHWWRWWTAGTSTTNGGGLCLRPDPRVPKPTTTPHLTAPCKQRHTAKRIFDRLREEQQAEVSYSRVRACVAVRRGAILAESGRAPVEVFVPQSHWPGEEAEVDFGDVVVEL